MNEDKSLIGVVFEGHSRSQHAIKDLQEQIESLEKLRCSAKETFSLAQESDLNLELSTQNILRSTSEIFNSSPKAQKYEKDNETNNSNYSITDHHNNSLGKMHLKDLDTSNGFDLTAILSQLSSPELNASLDSGDGNNDELINLLEKISTAGQSLQMELESVKKREVDLREQLLQLKSKDNGFHSYSTLNGDLSMLEKFDQNRSKELEVRCEKLQDAMLSLQDENMKLNRLLKEHPPTSTADASTSPGSPALRKNLRLEEELVDKEKKIKQMQGIIDRLTSLQQKTEDDLKSEKKEKIYQLQKINELSESLHQQKNESLQLNDSERKVDLLQLENEEQSKRIENLQYQLKLHQSSSVNEQTYLTRIDDLHKLLVKKENDIHILKESLRNLEELSKVKADMDQKKSGDILKRKEVLLLCEKYEQLKKNQKRLEEDLRMSQGKLQEESTKRWALESSMQTLMTENETFKKENGKIKGLKAEADEHAAVIRDYERLTQKYEALLELRLNEYGRIKKLKDIKRRQKEKELYESSKVTPRSHLNGREGGNSIRQNLRNSKRNLNEALIDSEYPQDVKSPRDHYRSRSFDHSFSRQEEKSQSQYELDQSLLEAVKQDNKLKILNMRAESSDRVNHRRRHTYDDIPTPRYKSKFARERLAGQIHTSRKLIRATEPDPEDEDENNTNFLTSTPNSKSRNFNSDCGDSTSIKMYVKNPISEKRWLPDKLPMKPERDCTSLNERGRRPYNNIINNKFESPRLRAKSLSPIRNEEFNELVVSSSRSVRGDRQKVSFDLPKHQRSQSVTSLDRSHYKSRFLRSLDSSLSPVEIHERCKNAYQEEYLKNMKGIDLTSSKSMKMDKQKYSIPIAKNSNSQFSNTQLDCKNAEQEKFRGSSSRRRSNDKSPYSEEYLKIMEEINNLKKNRINITNDSSNSPISYSNENTPRQDKTLTNSKSPKSILKNSNSSVRYNSNAEEEYSKPKVVREDFNGVRSDLFEISKQTISPPDMYKDASNDSIIDVVPLSHKVDNSLSSSTDSKSNSMHLSDLPTEDISAIDKFRTYSNADIYEDRISHNNIPSRFSKPEILSKSEPNFHKVEDLTIPYQLRKVQNDDDTDSTVSTTRDHIGRFEFLQDVQTTMKKRNIFSHEKPCKLSPEDNSTAERVEKALKAIVNDNGQSNGEKNNSELTKELTKIGLSSRQQEYADKLIKKYMKLGDS